MGMVSWHWVGLRLHNSVRPRVHDDESNGGIASRERSPASRATGHHTPKIATPLEDEGVGDLKCRDFVAIPLSKIVII
jgi:hypothetical protein